MGDENKRLPEENLDDIMASLGHDEEETPKKAWSFSEINDLLGDEEPEDEVFDGAPRYTGGENEFADDFEEELDFEEEYDTEASPFELSADQTTLMPEDRPAPLAEEEPLDAGIALGAPAEEFAEPAEEEPADEEPAAEPADEPADEELADEEPADDVFVEEPTMAFESVDALQPEQDSEEAEPVFVPSAEDEFPDEEPTRPLPDLNDLASSADEPDYVPGIVKDDMEEPEESEEAEGPTEKTSLRDRFRRMRNSFVRVVEGGEQDGEFSEEDLVDTVKDITREEEPELPKRSGVFGNRKSRKGNKEPGVRSTNELYKGLDENPQSPKMIMELADEKPELSREEKRALADKTVGIHPFFNESIEHQIRKVKTENVSEAEPVLEGEVPSSADPEAAAAALEGESAFKEGKTRKFVNTADLEPLPTIIDGNSELNIIDKTIVAKGGNKTIQHDAEAELDGQMSLEGFKDDVTPPEKVDEDHAEDSLRERRVKRIQDFKLDTEKVAADMEEEAGNTQEFELPEEPAPNQTLWELRTGNPRINHTLDTSDYISDRDAEETDFEVLKDTVERAGRKHLITAIIQGVLMIAGLVLTILIGSAGGNLELIGGSALVTILINAGIVILAAALGFGTIRKGIRGFFHRQINASGAATIVVLACLLEDLLLLIVSTQTAAQAGLYTGAACLALLLPSIARYLGLRRAKDNLTFMNSGLQLYGINIVESEEDTASIVRGMQMDDSVICYNGKIKTPTEFIRNSFADDPADYYAEKPTLIILGAALLYALIFGLVKHSFAVALSGFAVVCCIAIPAYVLLASNIALFLDDSRFSRKGSAILGHRAVEESAYVNTYAIDSTDLFPRGTTTIIGIKTFHNMRIDDAILYAAALVIESKGPLTDVFENTILGKNDLLPPVETLAYEERLGLSAWIRDRRILFGNRSLMTGHNVDVPTEEFEAQYTHNDRKVLYLAIAGKVAAMFVIKYRPVKQLRPCLRHMDRSGITVLVHNTDCNINEDMICKYYKLPKTAVKVLSPAAGDRVEEYLEAETYTSDAGLLHNGTVTASMRMLYEARRLYDGVSINNILAFAYSILAVILAVILGATSGTGLLGISDLKIVLFQLIWGLLALGLNVLRCRATKKLK